MNRQDNKQPSGPDDNPNRTPRWDGNWHISLFYKASECGNCKDFYARLTEHFKNRDDVIVEPSDQETDPTCPPACVKTPYELIECPGLESDRGTGARTKASETEYFATYEELEKWCDDTLAKGY